MASWGALLLQVSSLILSSTQLEQHKEQQLKGLSFGVLCSYQVAQTLVSCCNVPGEGE